MYVFPYLYRPLTDTINPIARGSTVFATSYFMTQLSKLWQNYTFINFRKYKVTFLKGLDLNLKLRWLILLRNFCKHLLHIFVAGFIFFLKDLKYVKFNIIFKCQVGTVIFQYKSAPDKYVMSARAPLALDNIWFSTLLKGLTFKA